MPAGNDGKMQAGNNNEKLISVREAATECGRNMETVRRWIWAGKLPAEKLGNQLFIKRSDFASYCRETATVQYNAKSRPEVVTQLKRRKEEIDARIGRGFTEETIVNTIDKQSDERMNELEHGFTEGETAMKAGNRGSLIKRMRKLREEIRARTGKFFDAETMIRELRDERDREAR